MPELPELDAAVDQLRDRLVGRSLRDFHVAAFSVLKTAEPSHTSLAGRQLTGVSRRGKFLLLEAEGRFAVTHLALAGWLKLGERQPGERPPARSGPLAVRLDFDDGARLDLTEQGKRKSMALWITDDPNSLERIKRLGPEADAVTVEELSEMLGATSSRLKTVLTDQTVMAGIGNAWSDEILHRAKLSPFAAANKLNMEQARTLHTAVQEVLAEVRDALTNVPLDRIKAKKKSLFGVHDRTGQACPVCGATVAEVSYVDRSLQYCPSCQTGGKKLSDRRMDRLLK